MTRRQLFAVCFFAVLLVPVYVTFYYAGLHP